MNQMRFIKVDRSGDDLPRLVPPHVAVREPDRGLMWGPTLKVEMTWDAAKKACAEFRLFGFSDWRLPTVEELFLIADRSKFKPAIDVDVFPDTKSGAYWASSPWSGSPGSGAWIVHFYGGLASSSHHGNECFVRPVRSVASAGQ